MPDANRDDSPTKPVPARALGSPAPLPARPRDGRPGGATGERRGAGFAPRPVRDGSPASAPMPPQVGADVDEVPFGGEDGKTWVARVKGRSGGSGSTPLLLLGFRPDGAAGGERAQPEREALIPGLSLAALTERQLADALARAVAPREGGEPPPFFAEAGDARTR